MNEWKRTKEIEEWKAKRDVWNKNILLHFVVKEDIIIIIIKYSTSSYKCLAFGSWIDASSWCLKAILDHCRVELQRESSDWLRGQVVAVYCRVRQTESFVVYGIVGFEADQQEIATGNNVGRHLCAMVRKNRWWDIQFPPPSFPLTSFPQNRPNDLAVSSYPSYIST